MVNASELIEYLKPRPAVAWRNSSARRDLTCIAQAIERKLHRNERLSAAEIHVYKNLSALNKNLFAPSLSHVFTSLGHVFAKPAAFLLLATLCILPLERSSSAINSQLDSTSVGNTQISEDSTPQELVQNQSPTGDMGKNLDIPEIALALAAEQEPQANTPPEPNASMITLPEFPSARSTEKLNLKEVASLVQAGLQFKDSEVKAESVKLRQQRNLVKFISGIIAAFRPSITDASTTAKYIVEQASVQNVDPIYVAAVIAIESRFSNTAQSNVGALGLMQLMPTTAQEIAGDNRAGHRNALVDPRTNIRLGISYLKQLEEKYSGNRFLALAAYNWGPTNVDKVHMKRNRIPGSVQNYSSTVLERTLSWGRHFARANETAEGLTVSLPTTERANG